MSGTPDRSFSRIGGHTAFQGRVLDVVVDEFRYGDGGVETREIVRAPGAVAIVAIDSSGQLVLVRQPREAIGRQDSLELPAGRLDRDGEDIEAAARRELAEEVGMGGGRWTLLTSYDSSVGMTDERVHVFLADGVEPLASPVESGEQERIEIVRRPARDLSALIAEVDDSKTLIGLLLLERAGRP